MNMDRFTVKSQEALIGSQELARKSQHAYVSPVHLLFNLVQQADGVVRPILEKVGVQPQLLGAQLAQALEKIPTVSGDAQLGMEPSLRDVIAKAEAQARSMTDDYVSTEHLLLALLEVKSAAQDVLQGAGVKAKQVLDALKTIRGSARVVDQEPEGKYQALKKYARDLTGLARTGKLDPVIGRDAEIRRVMGGEM